jgi:hypothetical protein
MPSISGICRSDTMTANGPCELMASMALAAPAATVTLYVRRKVRRRPARTFGSSSTQRIRGRVLVTTHNLSSARRSRRTSNVADLGNIPRLMLMPLDRELNLGQ